MSLLTRALPSPESEAGRSYRALVWKRLRRDRVAMAGLCLVAAFLALALLAPFIANGKPLLLSLGGKIQSPLLREFFAPMENPERLLERAYNYSLVVLLLLGALAATLRLTRARLTRRGRLIAGATLALAAAVPFFIVQARLDKTDYRDAARQARETGNGWAVFAPIPYGPFEQGPAYTAPDRVHWLGADYVGRDVASRIVHGARVSLSVGFVAVGIAVAIGLFLGSLAAYYGGWTDLLISRFIEIVMCFPTFLLILTIIAFLDKRSIFNIMLVIGFTGWTESARLVRGEMLRQKQLEYVVAARALGAGDLRIIFRHLLPNSIAPVFVAATFGVAGAILMETGLSFLGLGVQPPTASWGELLNQARVWPAGYWWLTLWPGAMIFAAVTVYNLVGEGLRDALDPRLRI